ncbi:winged helix-turn-helix transcriptional regulator [Natronorubrum sp. JWXQ-INN-674]|uniref:Winged helix-turn-helix transcriptional regulator n=1 Tax=Natronorubrum halalkaliphilum TaxID=2691917 RepID=A0A6B0VPX8_9EURY|nr:winged helix-turn-helix transcriptional regulator [Natronorubrum halalkaliphilum]MXV63223.1 winged helix-turn-helix transcriptional regulator [Natronorubrum halalkaliphilum]
MEPTPLDRIDKRILHALQNDARSVTTTELAADLEVSPSTVSNRIEHLERDGIITGYRATVDYEKAGFPLQAVIVGTASMSDRETVAKQACTVPNVVNVRELMFGEDNLLVKVVGETSSDLTRVAKALTELGVTVRKKILISDERFEPLTAFEPESELVIHDP